MTTEIDKKPTSNRCYKCGEDNIHSVCHHCGRSMCPTHHLSGDPTSVTYEFSDLDLQKRIAKDQPVHCEDCMHTVKKPSMSIIAMGVGVLILSFLVITTTIGIFLMLSGLVVLAVGIIQFDKRRKILRNANEFFPTIPNVDSLRMTDLIQYTMMLDGDEYKIHTKPVIGNLDSEISFNHQDFKRLTLFRKKTKYAEGHLEIPMHAGFLSLHGEMGIVFDRKEVTCQENTNTIPLISNVSKHDFFSEKTTPTRTWKIKEAYRLLTEPSSSEVPIKIIPALSQQTGQHVLELQLQLSEREGLRLKSIDTLELLVPVEWGEVNGNGAVVKRKKLELDNKQTTLRSITWKRPSLESNIFKLGFENKIDLQAQILGLVKATFIGSLSGTKTVRVFDPLGNFRNDGPEIDLQTIVKANFKLSLNNLRNQEIRIVPDAKKDKDKIRVKDKTFENITPDYRTISALTKAFNKQNFYVQRITEDPPQTGKDANWVNRSWDMAGRFYEGVYPIDFHITIGGEQQKQGHNVSGEGDITKTNLVVQGMYANQEMEEIIENTWDTLNAIVEDSFKQIT